jgi:hypothetical protein
MTVVNLVVKMPQFVSILASQLMMILTSWQEEEIVIMAELEKIAKVIII